MDGLLILLGLAMIAGNIYASVYLFGAWRNSPQWLVIIAGIMNILVLVSLFGNTL